MLTHVALTHLTFLASPSAAQSDPLIDPRNQAVIYAGTALLVLAIATAVGFFSRRVEQAFVTALVLSLILIAFFVLSR